MKATTRTARIEAAEEDLADAIAEAPPEALDRVAGPLWDRGQDLYAEGDDAAGAVAAAVAALLDEHALRQWWDSDRRVAR